MGVITLTILGNKCDMVKQQAVSEDEARGYAESIGAEHHYVSAKLGAGIDAAVQQTVRRLLQHRASQAQHQPPSYLPGELCTMSLLAAPLHPKNSTATMCLHKLRT